MLRTEDKHIDWPIVFAYFIMLIATIYFGAQIISVLFRG